MTYKKLTREETVELILYWSGQSEAIYAYKIVKKYYGATAHTVEFDWHGQPDDEGGSDAYITYFCVYDEEGEIVEPNYRLIYDESEWLHEMYPNPTEEELLELVEDTLEEIQGNIDVTEFDSPLILSELKFDLPEIYQKVAQN